MPTVDAIVVFNIEGTRPGVVPRQQLARSFRRVEESHCPSHLSAQPRVSAKELEQLHHVLVLPDITWGSGVDIDACICK